MKRIASPFSFGSMIDRVNREGRRVLVKEEAKRRSSWDALRQVRLWRRSLSRLARFRDCPIGQRRCSVSSSWLSRGGLPAFCRVRHRGGDGGALRCGCRHLCWRDVLDVRVVYLVAFLLSSLPLGVEHEDEQPYEAHRAGDYAEKFPRTFRCQVVAQHYGHVLGPLIPSLAVKAPYSPRLP